MLPVRMFNGLRSFALDDEAEKLSAKISPDRMLLSIKMPPDVMAIGQLLDTVSEFLSGHAGIRQEVRAHIMLAAEELIVNAVMHGGLTADAPAIGVTLRCVDDGVRTKIFYHGPAFDPTAPSDGRPTSLETPGGHGLNLVRNMADTFSYTRRGAWNVVMLSHSSAISSVK
jgi:anti-sigma regulatory factor (Ser/Thr protein kinase)